jgi:D-amino-acid dehydrogenase
MAFSIASPARTASSVPRAGLRPMLPDMLPRVFCNTGYNAGHGHLGWTLSAAMADAVAALVSARGKA